MSTLEVHERFGATQVQLDPNFTFYGPERDTFACTLRTPCSVSLRGTGLRNESGIVVANVCGDGRDIGVANGSSGSDSRVMDA